MLRHERRARFQVRFSTAFALAGIEIVGLIILAFHSLVAHRMDQERSLRLASAVATGAAMVDGGDVGRMARGHLDASPAMDALRTRVRTRIRELLRFVPEARSAAILRLGPEGDMVALVSEDESTGDGTPIWNWRLSPRRGLGTACTDDAARMTPRGLRRAAYAPIRDDQARTAASLAIVFDGEEAARWLGRLRWISVGLFLASIVFFATFGRHLADRLARPMRVLQDGADAIARGELHHTVRLRSGDEIGNLATAFNAMRRRLADVLREVTVVTAQVDRSSLEISTAVSDQASALKRQALSIAQLTATLERIAAVAGEIAERADLVLSSANRDLDHSRTAASSVERVIVEIERVARESERNQDEFRSLRSQYDEVDKVMELINQLAGRTKLIAFNAALEAVSAGEHGERFGVVAGEIRELAQSVMGSAAFISERVRDLRSTGDQLVMTALRNTQAIASATKLTRQTASTLDDMVLRAEELTKVAQDISRSASQQRSAHAEVVETMRGIMGGARETSRTIAEVSGATSKMTDMAHELNELVEHFTLPEDEDPDEDDGALPEDGPSDGGRRSAEPDGEGGFPA